MKDTALCVKGPNTTERSLCSAHLIITDSTIGLSSDAYSRRTMGARSLLKRRLLLIRPHIHAHIHAHILPFPRLPLGANHVLDREEGRELVSVITVFHEDVEEGH